MNLTRTFLSAALRSAARAVAPKPAVPAWLALWIFADLATAGFIVYLVKRAEDQMSDRLEVEIDISGKHRADIDKLRHRLSNTRDIINRLLETRDADHNDSIPCSPAGKIKALLADVETLRFGADDARMVSANRTDALRADVTMIRSDIERLTVNPSHVSSIDAWLRDLTNRIEKIEADHADVTPVGGVDTTLDSWPPLDGERFDTFRNRAGNGACEGWRVDHDAVWSAQHARWVRA